MTASVTEKHRIEDLPSALAKLEQLRDEVEVKVHLARADARDEWNRLEGRWKELQRHRGAVGQAVEAASGDVREAMELLVEEIAEGYRRIRRAL